MSDGTQTFDETKLWLEEQADLCCLSFKAEDKDSRYKFTFSTLPLSDDKPALTVCWSWLKDSVKDGWPVLVLRSQFKMAMKSLWKLAQEQRQDISCPTSG